MTIKECYDAMGADYQNTLNRFPNEAFIKKFVLKFLDDNSYANLKEANPPNPMVTCELQC